MLQPCQRPEVKRSNRLRTPNQRYEPAAALVCAIPRSGRAGDAFRWRLSDRLAQRWWWWGGRGDGGTWAGAFKLHFSALLTRIWMQLVQVMLTYQTVTREFKSEKSFTALQLGTEQSRVICRDWLDWGIKLQGKTWNFVSSLETWAGNQTLSNHQMCPTWVEGRKLHGHPRGRSQSQAWIGKIKDTVWVNH